MPFHVPELSRLHQGPLASDFTDGNNGAFALSSPHPGRVLFCIASDGEGWEHVSTRAVTSNDRSHTPTWDEMCYVKRLFWDDEDAVVQYHPPRSMYVNFHPNVLHLWRPVGLSVPIPPPELVGPLAEEARP